MTGRALTRQLTDAPEHLRPGPLLHPFKAREGTWRFMGSFKWGYRFRV